MCHLSIDGYRQLLTTTFQIRESRVVHQVTRFKTLLLQSLPEFDASCQELCSIADYVVDLTLALVPAFKGFKVQARLQCLCGTLMVLNLYKY